MASSEKRQNPRVPLVTDVGYSLNGRVWSDGQSININYDGILVHIKEEMSPNQVVHLVFELPNLPREDPVEAKGELTRVAVRRGQQVGLAFQLSNLLTRHAQAIQEFVDKLSP